MSHTLPALELSISRQPLLISFGGKICYNKSIAWQRKCDGDKRKCHARDEMPEDSDPFQDGTVLKEAFDRLNKYVVG